MRISDFGPHLTSQPNVDGFCTNMGHFEACQGPQKTAALHGSDSPKEVSGRTFELKIGLMKSFSNNFD